MAPRVIDVDIRRGREMVIPDNDVVYVDLTYDTGATSHLEMSDAVADKLRSKLEGGNTDG